MAMVTEYGYLNDWDQFHPHSVLSPTKQGPFKIISIHVCFRSCDIEDADVLVLPMICYLNCSYLGWMLLIVIPLFTWKTLVSERSS